MKEIAVKIEPGQPVTIPARKEDGSVLMDIIARASTDPAFDVLKLEKLLAMKQEWDRNQARKEFVSALTAFKADPPQIFKDKRVHFETQKGTTDYKHASLDNVSSSIGESLSKHGLSHRWDVDQAVDGRIKVTCILMHSSGYSEQVSMTSIPDASGNKNSIQAIGSAVAYLERYTLLAVSGMSVKDQDNDGATPPAPIAEPKEAVIVSDPITFSVMKGGVSRQKTTPIQFKINAVGGKSYFTLHEKIAMECKGAGESGASVRALLTEKAGAVWVDSVDVQAQAGTF